jgi:hypothetical protein
VQNYGLTHVSGGPSVSADQLKQLLTGAAGDFAAHMEIRSALHHALHMTFTSMFVIALGAVFAMLFMPAINIGTNKTVEKVNTADALH